MVVEGGQDQHGRASDLAGMLAQGDAVVHRAAADMADHLAVVATKVRGANLRDTLSLIESHGCEFPRRSAGQHGLYALCARSHVIDDRSQKHSARTKIPCP